MSALKPILDAFVGILMGVIGHLPGASGSTVAVIFKVYERMIEDIADIKNKLLKDLIFIIPLIVGLIAGTILCAKILDPFMEGHSKIALYFLFLALIICQIPDIYILGDDGNPLTKQNVLAFLFGLGVMMAIMALGLVTGEQSEGNWIIMIIVGVIYAIAAIAPGISSSTLLLAMGLFGVYNGMLADLNISLILPFLAGFVIGLILFAKFIDYAMKNHRKSAYMATLGLTVGSVVTIFVDAVKLITETNIDMGLWGEVILGTVIGLVLGLILRKLAHMYPDGK